MSLSVGRTSVAAVAASAMFCSILCADEIMVSSARSPVNVVPQQTASHRPQTAKAFGAQKPAIGPRAPGLPSGPSVVTGPARVKQVSFAVPDEQERTFEAPPDTPPPVPDPLIDTEEALQQPVYEQRYYYYWRRYVPPQPWVSVEALLWWTSKMDIPHLVTTSPQGTPADTAGKLPAAQTVLGATDIFGFPQRGFRIRGGHWFDTDESSGIIGEFFMLTTHGHTFNTSSTGDPILARPFTNLRSPESNDAQLIAYPGVNTGSIAFDAETRMYSVGVHYWAEYETVIEEQRRDGRRYERIGETLFGVQIGPRFSHLDDTMLIDEGFTSIRSGRSYLLRDSFKTENTFLGGEIGIRAQRRRGIFDFDAGIKLAIGGTRQELDIDGINTVINGTTQTTNRGGFLAHESNFGGWDRTQFSLIPSFDVGVGFRADNGWKFNVSYNFMYWTNVLRAGEQIETGIHEDAFLNPTPTPGPRPVPLFREADYLAHGISVAIEKDY